MSKRRQLVGSASGSGGGTPSAGPSARVRSVRLDRLGFVRAEMGRVYNEARRGGLDWQDAARAVFVLGRLADVLELTEVSKRLDRLERDVERGHDAGEAPTLTIFLGGSGGDGRPN